MKRSFPSRIVGWQGWVALPALGVGQIKAKIDTGAKTSALHAYETEEFERDGESWVRFDVHPVQRKKRPSIRCEAKIHDRREVRSSNGSVEERIVIRTLISLSGLTFPAELTLTNRDEMGFRMLVGREALKGRFLVDCGASLIQDNMNKGA